MNVRAPVLVAALAAAVLAVAPYAATSADKTTGVRLYFTTVSGRTLLSVERQVRVRTVAAVVAALVAGPTPAERRRGAAPALPRRVRLVSLQRQRGGRLLLSLRGASLVRLSTIPRLRVIAALTYTLASLREVERVRFSVDRRPWGVYNMQGRLIRDYSRATLERAMTACAPAEGCFSP